MTRFVAIRLLQMAAVVVIMSFIVYTLIGLMPGDPVQMMRQRHGEFRIGDGIGDNVDSTLDAVMVHAELDNFDQRGQRNPTHPLTPTTQIAAQPQPEHGKHFGESVEVDSQFFARRHQPEAALAVFQEQVLGVETRQAAAQPPRLFDREDGSVSMG